MDHLKIKFDFSKREKILAGIAISILLPLILYRLVVVPLETFQLKLERKNLGLEKKISKVELLGQEFRYYSKKRIQNNFSVNQRVDRIVNALQLRSRSNILVENNSREGTKKVILKVNDINLTELTQLIYKIENSKPIIVIENLDIGASFNNKRLFRTSFALSGR